MNTVVLNDTDDRYAFYENLKKRTGDGDPNNYCYAGGRVGRHLSYTVTQGLARETFPKETEKCVCGHKIKENCFLKHKPTGELIVVGNCCIKRYVPDCGRTCELCGIKHSNRKDNLCKTCRTRKLTIDDRVYLSVDYHERHDAKAKGAKFDSINRHWYAESKLNKELISAYSRIDAEMEKEFKRKHNELIV